MFTVVTRFVHKLPDFIVEERQPCWREWRDLVQTIDELFSKRQVNSPRYYMQNLCNMENFPK